MTTGIVGTFTLTLTEEERLDLLALIKHAFSETRVEAHRTHSPDYREQVLHQEEILRSLIEKLSL